jgi:integrase
MNNVHPIRERKHIDAMKKYLKTRPSQNALDRPRNHLLFTLGINVGLRPGDVTSLTWRDILDAETKRPRSHYVDVIANKTGKAIEFKLNNSAIDAINEYIEALGGPEALELDGYVFVSRKGENKPITVRQAHRIISEAAAAVGVKDPVGSHTLRKTFGYHAYKATNDLALVQEMLDHASSAITLRYIGIAQERKDKAILSLNL